VSVSRLKMQLILNTPRKQTLQGVLFTTFNIIQECNPTTACVLAEIKCFDICLIISGMCEMVNTNSKHNVIILDFNFVQLFTLVLNIQDPATIRVFWQHLYYTCNTHTHTHTHARTHTQPLPSITYK